MEKTNYYQAEAYKEFILRILEKTVTIAAVLMTIAVIIIVTKGDLELLRLEQEVLASESNTIIYEERIPVKRQLMKDIMELPLPEEKIAQGEIAKVNKKRSEIVTGELHKQISKLDIIEENQEVKEEITEDAKLLAKLMYAEEGILLYKLSEEDAKQAHMLAGSVVLHRLEMEYMGAESIEDVIYAKGQYDCASNGSIEQEVPDIVYQWAQELIDDGPIGPENLIYQAEFKQGTSTYAHIGNQYFCLD